LVPLHTKGDLISWAVLIGLLIRHPYAFAKNHVQWIDLPMIIWCTCPLVTSLTNGLGAYDGIQACVLHFVDTGIPYMIGRAYFGTYEGLKELAMGVFLGGVLLIPLVLFEVRMSPQLHTMVYGWYPHDWATAQRDGGGFRPSVFMSHGLELAIWNMAAAFIGWQLYFSKAFPLYKVYTTFKAVHWNIIYGRVRLLVLPLFKIPYFPSVTLLTLGLILSRSFGAVVLLGIAMLFYELCCRKRMLTPLLILVVLPILFLTLRASGYWDVQNLIAELQQTGIAEGRVGSFAYRINMENLILSKAMMHAEFGWGRFGRGLGPTEGKVTAIVPDSRWVLIFTESGMLGLLGGFGYLLLPVILFFWKFPMSRYRDPLMGAAAVLGTLLVTTFIDDLINAMNNPLIIVSAGGLGTLIMLPEAEFLRTEEFKKARVRSSLQKIRVI
jgi:hypothetical protein